MLEKLPSVKDPLCRYLRRVVNVSDTDTKGCLMNRTIHLAGGKRVVQV